MYNKKGLKIAFSFGFLLLATSGVNLSAAETNDSMFDVVKAGTTDTEAVEATEVEAEAIELEATEVEAIELEATEVEDVETTTTKADIKITKAIDGAELYDIVPASESVTNEDVCVYVTADNSEEYRDLVNGERATWDLDNVQYSKDLEEGAMLRAGENVVLHESGQQEDVISHDSVAYYVGWENLAASSGNMGYNASFPFKGYMKEKQYLPDDFDPENNNYAGQLGVDSQVIGHYTTMVTPSIAYVGQGAAYSDSGCDGSAEYIVYANEHSAEAKDLYPNLASEITNNLEGTVAVEEDTKAEDTSDDTDNNYHPTTDSDDETSNDDVTSNDDATTDNNDTTIDSVNTADTAAETLTNTANTGVLALLGMVSTILVGACVSFKR